MNRHEVILAVTLTVCAVVGVILAIQALLIGVIF